MKKIIFTVLFITVSLSISAQEAGIIEFKNEGFKLNALESTGTNYGHVLFQMFLPVDNGFTPSVNVMTQDYTGTLQDYKELSDTQFESLGLELIKSEITGNRYIIEYRGNLQGREIHAYSVAQKRGYLVYLSTGMTTLSSWDKYKDKIISVIDSFELTK